MPRPWNTYVYFRRTIKLPAGARRATVRASADARYVLYVNGRRVHQGPARSFAERQSYDTLELGPYLEVGENSIGAIVHQFGVPTFFSQYRGASGFLLDGVVEVEGEEEPFALHTPSGWLCREAKGWRKDVVRLSIQMGFQEHFDADADPADWMSATFVARKEDGWIEPQEIGPVGCHPWLAMEARGVPLLADHVENFAAVGSQFRGENGRGYKVTSDVSRFLWQEQRKKERNLLEKPAAMLADNNEATIVAPPTDSEFIAAVLDLGTYRTGHLILDIAEAVGDEIVDVILSEDLDKSGGPLLRGTAEAPSFSEDATALRYRCRLGKLCWESFHLVGFVYATLIYPNNYTDTPLKVRRVAVRQVHAALEEIGSFECSDDRLNQIWRVAKTTQLNCAFDALVDCPWREQAQWWGDARVQAQVMAYAFGDFSLLERGIRQVAASQASDGSLHAHPPADVPGHRLPDFMLTWVGSLWDYYFHTGRAELVRECLPALRRLLEFFGRHEAPNRLIGGFDGFWVFLDWAPVRKADYSATLNLAYLQALRWATALFEVAGDAEGVTRSRASAKALAESIDTHFWDAAGKVWRDGFDPARNAPVEEVSQHANALAILLDLHPEAHAKIARDVLLKPAQARRSKVVTGTPFYYAYVLEAMVKAGLRDEAIGVIRDRWGAAFLDRGMVTFGEHWEPTGSLCHAWSASPLYHLSQQVLGVTPITPGWRQVRVAPSLAKLEFAKGIVPSPLGPVRVEWEKGGEDQLAVRLDVPDGMEVQFVSPLGDARTLEAGAHEFHT
jgi:alpha-L-rhamnosidase